MKSSLSCKYSLKIFFKWASVLSHGHIMESVSKIPIPESSRAHVLQTIPWLLKNALNFVQQTVLRFMALKDQNAFVIVMLQQKILVLILNVPDFVEVIQHKSVVVIGE